MVPEKPSRRSRSGKTPVTLDLAAEEKATVAEPVRSDDSDTPPASPVSEAPAPVEDAAPAQSAPASGEATAPDQEQAAAHTAAKEEAASPHASETHDRREETPPLAEETVRVSETASTAQTPPPPAQPAPPAPRQASSTGFLAAGIAGGLVALLLAGAMQYAGVIPGLGPQTKTDTAAIEALRQQIASLRTAAPSGDLVARIEALEKGGSSGLNDQISALQQELGQVKSASDALVDDRAQLVQRLQVMEQRMNQPGREQAIARALAAAGLKAATDRGGSFAAELQTYAEVAANDPAVEELKTFAENGVPTRAELARRFPNAANAMMDAIHQPAADEGIAARLMGSAMRIVKVRPVGEVEGDTPEAKIARIEERIKNGSLKAAASEWDNLPDAAKQAAQSYRQALDARIKVDDLSAATLTRAMAASGSNG